MNSQASRIRDADGTSPRDLRRQKKIDQIVQAAANVFLEDGFSATSMDRIVAKAGVSKRTLYNYYASKEEIFVDVIQMQLGSLYQNLEPVGQGSGDLAGQLRRVGTEMLRIANSNATISLFRLTAAEAQRFPKLAHQFFEQRLQNVIDGIATLLDVESPGAGLLIADTKEAAEYFVDLLFGTAYLRVVFGTTPPMDDDAIRTRTKQALDYFFETYGSQGLSAGHS